MKTLNLVVMVVLVAVSFLFGGCASRNNYGTLSDAEINRMTDAQFTEHLARVKKIKERREAEAEITGSARHIATPDVRTSDVVRVPGLKVSVGGGVLVYPERRVWERSHSSYGTQHYEGVESQYDKRPLSEKCRSNPDTFNGFCGAVNRNSH